MKKSLFIMALGAIALTSCSQDEVIEVQKDAITFSTVGDNVGRATETSTNSIDEFKVWGVLTQDGGTNYYTYINGLECTRAETGTQWLNHNSGYYWPEGTMDFYAVSPNSLTATLGTASVLANNQATISDVEIAANATTQTDILYAVATNQVKQTTSVDLNFQHALTQVSFKVKVAETFKQSVKVVVNSISVKNLQYKGDYSLPKTGSTNDDNIGSWTMDADIQDFSVSVGQTLNYTYNELNPAAVETATIPSMFLMPQGLAASTPAVWTSGGCFVLDVDVYAQTIEGTEIKLVDELTYVPYTFNWEEGNHYTYTFIYDEGGNGGLKPDGTEQLLKIKFDVDVDEFADQAEVEIPVQATPVVTP